MPAWLEKVLPNLTIEPPGERAPAGPVVVAIEPESS
jgi:hypothetical protein